MGWFDWLRKSPTPVIEHPAFGRVRAAHRPESGNWLWETLEFVETPRGPADVGFEAPETGPTPEQERHFDWIVANLDALTVAAAPLVAGELTEWLERPFPANPWDELGWEGVHLTSDASPDGRWDLSYSSNSWPDAMITVYFERGKPTLVQLDD